MSVIGERNKRTTFNPATGKVEYGDVEDGFYSFEKAKEQKPGSLITYGTTTFNLQPQTPQQQQTSTNVVGGGSASNSAGSGAGGLMGQFNNLLNQRQGLQNGKMSLQEQQLQRVNTQKNNTMFKTTFTNRDNMIDLMRQLLDASRRTTAAQQRVFM